MLSNLSFRAVLRAHKTACAPVEEVYEAWLADSGAQELQRLNSPARGGAALRATARTAEGDVSLSVVANGDHSDLMVDASEPLPDELQLRSPDLMAHLIHALQLGDAGVRLTLAAELIDEAQVAALAEYLLSEERTLPLIVVSRNTRDEVHFWRARARVLATTFAGAATVAALTPAGGTALRAAAGSHMGVWGGAVRTYLPGVHGDLSKERVYELAPVLPHHYTQDWPRSLALISRSVARLAFARSMPRQRPAGDRATGEPPSQGAHEVGAELTAALARLELAELAIDRLTRDLSRTTAQLELTTARLAEEGLLSIDTDESPDGTAIASCTDAVLHADEHLATVAIGEDALVGAEHLDLHPKSNVWGRKAWRVLQALDGYAQARRGPAPPPNFLAYCQQGTGVVVPATTVALVESETIRAGQQYRRARTFGIDPSVSGEDRVFMEAHVRIDSGKHPAPRLYFLDDTGEGRSGKVHVGYLGEHPVSPQTN